MSYTSEVKSRCRSKLSFSECLFILQNSSRPFEALSNDDLDAIYRAAFGHWAYHMSREGYIKSLEERRKGLFVTQYVDQLTQPK